MRLRLVFLVNYRKLQLWQIKSSKCLGKHGVPQDVPTVILIIARVVAFVFSPRKVGH